MIIMSENGKLTFINKETWKAAIPAFSIEKGENGCNYVIRNTVVNYILHVSEGNEKTGDHVLNFNLPVEYTCKHTCECYKNAACYACSGCYLFADNQAGYSENLNFFNNVTSDEFIQAIQKAIEETGFSLFRWFTCGDIVNKRFFDCMVQLAKNNPSIKFWSYTKKYEIVNNWINENGELPDNLVIIFSHWMNEDGSYFPMNNKHNLPTSEFIPFGREELLENITHVCPCSDPSVIANCENCDHPCYSLKKGESMGLCEHSTSQTKNRDRELKAAKNALKAAKKAEKQAARLAKKAS